MNPGTENLLGEKNQQLSSNSANPGMNDFFMQETSQSQMTKEL